MLCPICEKPMWDNRNKKINPKAPDFRCKDTECKYSLNSDTGEYEPGDFPTGVWLEHYATPEPIPPAKPKVIPPPKPKTDIVKVDLGIASMLMSYSKDLVCAQIQSDKYSEPLGIEDVIKNYERMKQAL